MSDIETKRLKKGKFNYLDADGNNVRAVAGDKVPTTAAQRKAFKDSFEPVNAKALSEQEAADVEEAMALLKAKRAEEAEEEDGDDGDKTPAKPATSSAAKPAATAPAKK